MKNKLFPSHHSFLLPQERQQQDELHIALLNVSAHRHLLIFSCRREIGFSILDDMLNRLRMLYATYQIAYSIPQHHPPMQERGEESPRSSLDRAEYT